MRKVEFENFMSLQNVSVELEPLTVFVGRNGSGKSAIFKGLVSLSKLLGGAPIRGHKGESFVLEPGVTLDDVVWSGNSGLPIRFRVWFSDDGDEPGYSLELRKGAAGWSVTREKIRAGDRWIEVDQDNPFGHSTERGKTMEHRPPLRATLRYLIHPFINDAVARPEIEPILQLSNRYNQAWRYRPSAIDIASFVKPPTEPGHTIYVRENGWGVAWQLQELQGRKRSVFQAVEKAVCQLFPHIKAIGFEADWQGIRLNFMTERSQDPVRAPQESDGILLATFLFWRLYTSSPFLRVCLEEPEHGLHPFLLADRFKMLKKFTEEGQDWPAIQLLVATHSPEFLRAVKAHPTALWKEIRLVEFAQGSGTTVRGLRDFREACKLIEEYLTEVEEHWKPVVQGWGSAGQTA